MGIIYTKNIAMISVVIPAYNEENAIEACLEALMQQNTSQSFEIILVNNNSTDSMVKKAKVYADRLPLKIVHETKKGRGAARKKGFDTAAGNIILSTDADTIIPPHWIETMTAHLADGDIIAVTGTGKITDRQKVLNALFNFCQPLSMRVYRLTFGHYWLSGFNFAITKDAYHKSGGFNDSLNAQEDTELAFRVKNIGKVKFVKDIPVIMSGRRYKKGFFIGLLPYFSTFIGLFFFKRTNMLLSDPR
jgi:cellulose synthase/poly-beta-1,6-N-acetylglucosamine synthase-like glycosyltransferase